MLDHLVFGCPDLAAGVEQVQALTGVRPVPGGQHVGRGTANYLLGLGGGAYLEIVGPDPNQPGHTGPRPFDVAELDAARLVTWAIRTDDVDQAIAAARTAGHDPGEPAEMSRQTPDGRLLRWRLTPASADGLVPFLIDWGTSVHPSQRGLPEVLMISMRATHPEPAATWVPLSALSADLEVRIGNRIGLTALLAGRQGEFELT
ncbi:VOC family protein [soil metagenome]